MEGTTITVDKIACVDHIELWQIPTFKWQILEVKIPAEERTWRKKS